MGEGAGMPLGQLDEPEAATDEVVGDSGLADTAEVGTEPNGDSHWQLDSGANEMAGEDPAQPGDAADPAGSDLTSFGSTLPDEQHLDVDQDASDRITEWPDQQSPDAGVGSDAHEQSVTDWANASESSVTEPEVEAMAPESEAGAESLRPGEGVELVAGDTESGPSESSGSESGSPGSSVAESGIPDSGEAEPGYVPSADLESAAAEQPTPDESADVAAGGGARLEQLEREGEVAADFLERLLDIADLDGDIDVDVDGDRAAVAVVDSEEGRVPRRLVGPDGRVLEALQELTRLAVQTATGERSRLMLDVGGFRAERRTALVNLARSAIAEVKESGQQRALADMTAFERKVVHDEVTAAGLVSESEGVEPHRHIVILPG